MSSVDARSVLVSLRPEYASAIADGRKTVELRRRFPRSAIGGWLVQYVTLPVGAVVGMSPIIDVRSGTPRSLWRRYRDDAGISRGTFFDYFEECEIGYAVELGAFKAVGPLTIEDMGEFLPGFRAPQSYRYVDSDVLDAVVSTPPPRLHR